MRSGVGLQGEIEDREWPDPEARAGVKHNNIPEPDSEMKQVQNSSACLHK